MGACFGRELFFLLVLLIKFLAKIFCANLLGLAPGASMMMMMMIQGLRRRNCTKEKKRRKRGDALRS